MYFDTSSKLKRLRADESARLRGEDTSGRASKRAKGNDIVLGALELVESSEDMGVGELDRKSTRLNSSHSGESRMPSSA